ncbi:hypothetical protein MBLNU13_g03171t2 [Cladosporium sp. NU13]
MAPLKSVKKNAADQRVQLILDFAIATAQALNDRSPITTNTLSELEAFVKQPFPSPNAVTLARKSSEYDTQGSRLWNSATKILRDHHGDEDLGPKVDFRRFGMLLRAFAYFLLDAAHNTSSRRTKDSDKTIRIFKIALKASRCSLDNDDLDLALKLLESCSKYISVWEEETPVIRMADSESVHEELLASKLSSEFYLYRMVHASKTGRIDLADHFFTKANITGDRRQNDGLLETAADLCYEIGRSQQHESLVESALLWLERAHQLINGEDMDSPSMENEDLRLAIAASFVESLTRTTDPANTSRAWNLLTSLEQDYGLGNRMAILAMQLNVLMNADNADIAAASAVVIRMIRSSVLTDLTYRMIMQSVCKIKRVSLDHALSAIEQLATTRLLPDLDAVMESDQVKSWLEKAVVTYTSFCTAGAGSPSPEAAQRMSTFFDHLLQQASDLLSPRATHAMQALIWKASNGSQGSDAEAWLDVLQHSLFREECDIARAAFYALPVSSQNEGMTRYLAYKLALKSNDIRLAGECLESLLKHVDREPRYLHACVLEAQQSGNRAMAVAALQALVNQAPSGAQFPALFRCTARLLMEELGDQSPAKAEATGELVHLFKTVSANTKVFRQDSEEQWRAEIQWWSKNAFNIALQQCTEMQPEHLVSLLRACNKFLECYPDDSGLMHRDDVVQRKQICHFLCASALTVLGRTADDRQRQLQHYLEVQREVNTFLASWQPPPYPTADDDLHSARALELLRYNVESVFKLEQWDKLDAALAACLNFQGAARWDTLADLVIIIYDQTSRLAIDSSATAKVPELLQRIINETWSKDKDVVKLARWLRFTFSVGLSDSDGGISVKLVEQAAAMARRWTEMRNDPYPEDELQWLATMAFNKAVDLLAIENRQAADQWMEAALELARYAADNGSLHTQLTRTRQEAERRMRRQ